MTHPQAITNEEAARAFVESLADDTARRKIELFCDLLIAENGRQNLIAKASEKNLWQRHIADSAQLLLHVPRETPTGEAPRTWLDLGSGPGLPGLVIAIMRPDYPVVLVESRARRVAFLEYCVAELELANCKVEGSRLERVLPFPTWVISARAFAPLDKLLSLSAPFSTKATRYLLPKGRSAAHELDAMSPSIRKMFHVKQSLTDVDAGIIVSS